MRALPHIKKSDFFAVGRTRLIISTGEGGKEKEPRGQVFGEKLECIEKQKSYIDCSK